MQGRNKRGSLDRQNPNQTQTIEESLSLWRSMNKCKVRVFSKANCLDQQLFGIINALQTTKLWHGNETTYFQSAFILFAYWAGEARKIFQPQGSATCQWPATDRPTKKDD
jgi:hypothetical protein